MTRLDDLEALVKNPKSSARQRELGSEQLGGIVHSSPEPGRLLLRLRKSLLGAATTWDSRVSFSRICRAFTRSLEASSPAQRAADFSSLPKQPSLVFSSITLETVVGYGRVLGRSRGTEFFPPTPAGNGKDLAGLGGGDPRGKGDGARGAESLAGHRGDGPGGLGSGEGGGHHGPAGEKGEGTGGADGADGADARARRRERERRLLECIGVGAGVELEGLVVGEELLAGELQGGSKSAMDEGVEVVDLAEQPKDPAAAERLRKRRERAGLEGGVPIDEVWSEGEEDGVGQAAAGGGRGEGKRRAAGQAPGGDGGAKRGKIAVADAAGSSHLAIGAPPPPGDPEPADPFSALSPLVEELLFDLFDPAWTVRHGACLALKEILIPLAARLPVSWLSDTAVRLLCVLALDRFGDYVADGVVAPVRESCAQCLAVALARASPALIARCAADLAWLLGEGGVRRDWQIRHGGALGIMYVTAAAEKVGTLGGVLGAALPVLAEGVSDPDDDVRSVCAGALLRMAASLPPGEAAALRERVWGSLADLNDLTSSTGPVLDLLSALCAAPGPEGCAGGEPWGAELVPKIFPFFRHPRASARASAIACCTAAVRRRRLEAAPKGWDPGSLVLLARLAFQALVSDADPLARERARGLAEAALLSEPSLAAAVAPAWAALLGAPAADEVPAEAIVGVPFTRSALESKARPPPDGGGAPPSPHHRPPAAPEPLPPLVLLPEWGRTDAAWAMGLACSLAGDSAEPLLLEGLASAFGGRRLVWALAAASAGGWCRPAVTQRLEALAQQAGTAPYAEHAAMYARMRLGCRDLVASFARTGLPRDLLAAPLASGCMAWRDEEVVPGCKALLGDEYGRWVAALATARRVPSPSQAQMRAHLATQAEALATASLGLHVDVRGAAAYALVSLRALPATVSPVVNALLQLARLSASLAARETLAPDGLAGLAAQRPELLDKLCASLRSTAVADRTRFPDVSLGLTAPPAAADATAAAEALRASARASQGSLACLRAIAQRCSCPLATILPALAAGMPGAGGCEPDQASTDALVASLSLPKSPELLAHALALGLHPAASIHTQRPAAALVAQCCGEDSIGRVVDRALAALQPLAPPSSSPRGAALVLLAVCPMEPALPYLAGLVGPLISAMAAGGEAGPHAARAFAACVHALPLEESTPDPPGMDDAGRARRVAGRAFVRRLLRKDSAAQDEIRQQPAGLRPGLSLRPYQLEGVEWLSFLRECGLHGALCDDMGLGKTAQAICAMSAATAADSTAAVAAAAAGRCSSSGDCPIRLPHLVVCPSTLVDHWCREIPRFSATLRAVRYGAGGPKAARERQRALDNARRSGEQQQQQQQGQQAVVIVTSYEVLRADPDLQQLCFGYCVLDEAHVVRNPATKAAQACRRVQARHRLVLTGTPIHNYAADLWSLFDFLMPGYLGDQAEFEAAYGRPIAQSRDTSLSSRAFEEGRAALAALHRRVLPFILRRKKEEVLADVPAKTVQDYFCELTDVQAVLYRGMDGRAGVSAFESLQYLRKVCSHPSLVWCEGHPQAEEVRAALAGRDISEPELGAKLVTLLQLLADCGLDGASGGGGGASGREEELAGGSPAHRFLIFAQQRAMLDLVEALLARSLPGASYLRLDGATPASQRNAIACAFNDDPTIDLLLLTTKVGSLGLNLTGADTVVFLEHDWNPQVDLQAQDRAHRIGQRRSVVVYRLITSKTIEERVMSLQAFKKRIAGAVVNADNASMSTMNAGDMLQLLKEQGDHEEEQGPENEAVGAADAEADGLAGVPATILQTLPPLWGPDQYEEEYDVKRFLEKLK